MYHGVDLGDVNAVWQKAIHKADDLFNLRNNDHNEKHFWAQRMAALNGYHPDGYSHPIAETICELVRRVQADTLLEIGPGWGNYTIPLAKECLNISCVDISPDVLEYIQRTMKELGMKPVETICSKWEDCQLNQQYDVIVGYNCFYRMEDLKASLKKVNDFAKKLCVVGMLSGPDQPYLLDFEKELSLKVNWKRFDYIYFLNALYSLGIDANCKIIPTAREYAFDTLDDLLRAETFRIEVRFIPKKQLQKFLCDIILTVMVSIDLFIHSMLL